MTNAYSGTPNNGVTVDEGRVSDFLLGMRASNAASNRAAGRRAVELTLGLIAYSANAKRMRNNRNARRNRAVAP